MFGGADAAKSEPEFKKPEEENLAV